jgi:glycosyltransferase involved in cell wall biosynthesis
MNIGILGTRGIPNAYGGFEQFAQYLAKGLVEKGHIVSVYNSSSHPYQESTWYGVQIIHCNDPENRIGSAGQFIYDYNCLQDARKRNFDILLQLGYTSSSVWHQFWPKKAINIINMDGLEWKRAKYNNLTQKFLQWAEGLAVRHGDVLIADSTGIKDYIQSKYQKEAVYISYGADIPESFSDSYLTDLSLQAYQYYLLIARMEPENNIELVIRGYLESGHHYPLIILGNTQNKYGQFLFKKYASALIQFPGAVYDQSTINALRHFSSLYFHGHSVGGTNPSLLEAMACGCNIAAHNNVFNNAILGDDACYFSKPKDVKKIISQPLSTSIATQRKILNLEKVKKIYNWTKIINEYETIFLQASEKRIRLREKKNKV